MRNTSTERHIAMNINGTRVRWYYMRPLRALTTAVITIALLVAFAPVLAKGISDAMDYDVNYYNELHEDKVGTTENELIEARMNGGIN